MEGQTQPENETAPTVRVNNRLYYGVDGAAKTLGISTPTLRREIAKRNIRNLRVSGKILILPEWLDEWVDRRTIKPTRK